MLRIVATLCTALALQCTVAIFPFPRSFIRSDFLHSFGGLDVPRAVGSDKLHAAIQRLLVNAQRKVSSAIAKSTLSLNFSIQMDDEALKLGTAEDYSVHFDIDHGATIEVKATTIYGALHALESIAQLIQPCPQGISLPSSFSIIDSPSYSWRGLMLDTGRRFFTLSTLQGILDVMAASKLNVLHLHASDFCRWSVQSARYGNLTDALTGILAGFYTQADIVSLLAYASARGIRVVPEFDVPGHSRGMIPLQWSQGLQFCDDTDESRSQLYGDPANVTYTIITNLFTEMAALFPDSVFHIGSDETASSGRCTVESTFELERAVLQFVQDLGKTPAGWEEVLFDAGAATPDTIVFAWSRRSPSDIIARGNRAVDNNSSHFYLTAAGAEEDQGWARFWYDIGTGLNATALPLLLGGETSMWTDTYTYIEECGAFGQGPVPVGAPLFDPAQDNAFAQSIGGMIWPRTFAAAAAFWNFNASVQPTDPSFVQAINNITTEVIGRGLYACPVNCTCDQLSACGVPYMPQPQPATGYALYLANCSDPINALQNWTLTSSAYMQAGSTVGGLSPLCVQDGPSDKYPLKLGACSSDAASWTHRSGTSELVRGSDGDCLDVRMSDGSIGTYECNSSPGGPVQANQQWAIDPTSGFVVSLYNGQCVGATDQAR